jgi:hypothetical protein
MTKSPKMMPKHRNLEHRSLTRQKAKSRSGFASTLLVLVVMLSVTVLGVVCAKTLVGMQRHLQRSSAETQLAWMEIASENWLAAGGQLTADAPVELLLGPPDDSVVCTVLLSRGEAGVEGIAEVRRITRLASENTNNDTQISGGSGRLIGSRRFTLDLSKTEGETQ